MNPYLFTITFLMIMGFLTSSETIRFTQSSLEHICYKGSRNCLVAAEELRELSRLEEFREEEVDDPYPKKKPETDLKKSHDYVKKARALGINAARPPNNSRLNIFSLLHKQPNKDSPKEFSLYEVAARLMRSLYKDEDFFKEIALAEYRILDKLIEKKEETVSFTTPDQLSSLQFEDDTLQKIFYQMLKGTKKASSLLNFITFDQVKGAEQARKINLLFADPLILKAIFPEESLAEKLIFHRDQIWEEIAYQETYRLETMQDQNKGRRDFSNELKKILEDVLISEGLNPDKYKSQVFDCTLNKPGNIIFLEDPHTGRLIREKYIK